MRLRVLSTLLVLGLGVAAPAHAGTVAVADRGDGLKVYYTADRGSVDQVDVGVEPDRVWITSGPRGDPPRPAPPCAAGNDRQVDCPVAGVRGVVLELGDRDDRGAVHRVDSNDAEPQLPMEMFGRDGDDELFGSKHDDRLDGGPGDDQIIGEAGDDRLIAGTGHDALYGGLGADILRGGTGRDTVDAQDIVERPPSPRPVARRDRLRCGAGIDFMAVDRLDRYARGCEGGFVANRLDKLVRHWWTAYWSYTIVNRLLVRVAPPFATIFLECAGAGCPLKQTKVSVGRHPRRVPLAHRFRGARLRPGARITVTITTITFLYGQREVRFTIRRNDVPRVRVRVLPGGPP